MARRLVITVCSRETGVVVLPVEAGERASRLDARAVAQRLRAIAEHHGVADRVLVRDACAGGCSGRGPNVSVAIYPIPAPGERGDQVAVSWRTYVYTLPTLACLAQVIEENLDEPLGPRRTRPGP
ncbi:MAG TPA: hypothetical protein VHT71_04000 [Methylomirabilota bacterium]|jgi:hypothetical protein|nr:hypothetical protein [Methylomirabilota bacterium]